jgi:DNA repair exonuclease SbcCD nuclease subunit
MKIAILNDTHCGVRNDMVEMSDYQGRFYKEIFFPYLDQHDIKHIIHMGDYFDRRKFINFASMQRNIEHFVKPMIERGITMDLIIGNHDTYYKNTNEVNSPALLLYGQPNITVHEEPVVKEYDGLDVALVPWINNENYADNIEFFQSAPAPICMGHFEIEGAMMNPAMVCSHGLNPSYLKRFEKVYSGHFHHKTDVENIRYVGSQMQFTWSDFGDEKYFHIFDTDTREMLPVHNPLTMFEKAFYNDTEESFESIANDDYEKYRGKFVKVIVIEKENPYWFDTFLDKLHGVNPLHVSVVDDNKHMDFFDDEEIENVEDTLTILSKYVEGLEIQGKKKELDKIMKSLYHEALEEHNFL